MIDQRNDYMKILSEITGQEKKNIWLDIQVSIEIKIILYKTVYWMFFSVCIIITLFLGTQRPLYMQPKVALEYGIIDHVIK